LEESATSVYCCLIGGGAEREAASYDQDKVLVRLQDPFMFAIVCNSEARIGFIAVEEHEDVSGNDVRGVHLQDITPEEMPLMVDCPRAMPDKQ
jgi:hypothetical protein